MQVDFFSASKRKHVMGMLFQYAHTLWLTCFNLIPNKGHCWTVMLANALLFFFSLLIDRSEFPSDRLTEPFFMENVTN